MEVVKANKFFTEKSKESDLIILGENISTPENIGSFVRIAGNFGVKNVYIINTSSLNIRKIKKTASSALGQVNLELKNIDFLKELKSNNYTIVALDTIHGALDIKQYKFKKKTAILVGNERYGLSKEILKYCQDFVYIDMPGNTKSMNVSHALAIAVFKYISQV